MKIKLKYWMKKKKNIGKEFFEELNNKTNTRITEMLETQTVQVQSK